MAFLEHVKNTTQLRSFTKTARQMEYCGLHVCNMATDSIILHCQFTLSQGDELRINCDSPERTIGSVVSPFLTWSDSPVKELSSTFRSLLCMITPSAGNKSPETTPSTSHHNITTTLLYNLTSSQIIALNHNCILVTTLDTETISLWLVPSNFNLKRKTPYICRKHCWVYIYVK